VGGSEARKPRSLKSGGGLEPSSLIEVYTYVYISSTDQENVAPREKKQHI